MTYKDKNYLLRDGCDLLYCLSIYSKRVSAFFINVSARCVSFYVTSIQGLAQVV